ncbi:hypothetical protein PHLCEN_2v9246, partial [Hermanssonia centrifuga]
MNKHERERAKAEHALAAGDRQPCHLIWAGDFNRHHTFWERPENTHLLTRAYLEAAQPLVEAIGAFDLHQLLPLGVPTLKANTTGNLTRPDNIFASMEIAESFLSCHAIPYLQPICTDHFPIHTELDLTSERTNEHPRWNWRKVEQGKFHNAVEEKLTTRDLPTGEIKTPEEFQEALDDLMQVIYDVREELVPKTSPTPYDKRWWNADLAKTRKEVQKLSRTSHQFRLEQTHFSHAEYKRVRNRFKDKIQKAKQEHWDAYLEDIGQDTIWNFSKYVKGGPSDGGRSRIPRLEKEVPLGRPKEYTTDNAEKSRILHDIFFPPPGDPPDVPDNFDFPREKFKFKGITRNLIRSVVAGLKCYKAPGQDEVPNEVFKWCIDLLLPFLFRIFQASIKLGIYADDWK